MSEYLEPLVVKPEDSNESVVDYVDKKVDELCGLEENWDGEGALPVSPKTAELSRKEIRNRIEELRKKGVRLVWLAPAQDGAICFDFLFTKDEDEEGYCIYPEDFE